MTRAFALALLAATLCGCGSDALRITAGIARAICRAIGPGAYEARPGHVLDHVEVDPDGGVTAVYR